MSPITVPTLSKDSTLEVIIRRGKIFVKGDGSDRDYLPQVIEADVRASNGVIHVIDDVILPAPSGPDLPTITENWREHQGIIDIVHFFAAHWTGHAHY